MWDKTAKLTQWSWQSKSDYDTAQLFVRTANWGAFISQAHLRKLTTRASKASTWLISAWSPRLRWCCGAAVPWGLGIPGLLLSIQSKWKQVDTCWVIMSLKFFCTWLRLYLYYSAWAFPAASYHCFMISVKFLISKALTMNCVQDFVGSSGWRRYKILHVQVIENAWTYE